MRWMATRLRAGSKRGTDSNEWLLQEVTTRLPGRVEQSGVATLAELLLETAKHHDRFERRHWPTTGGPGTRRTSTRASTGAPPRRPTPPPTAT